VLYAPKPPASHLPPEKTYQFKPCGLTPLKLKYVDFSILYFNTKQQAFWNRKYMNSSRMWHFAETGVLQLFGTPTTYKHLDAHAITQISEYWDYGH